jgi:hypothetical protein
MSWMEAFFSTPKILKSPILTVIHVVDSVTIKYKSALSRRLHRAPFRTFAFQTGTVESLGVRQPWPDLPRDRRH